MEKSTIDLAGRSAAYLSVIEIGLGSVLHGFNIPLAGHFLSLNQFFLLTRAVVRARGIPGRRFLPLTISNIAAVLKSLSPAGKKLTPMLAISAQGALFNSGTALFGANWIGLGLGAALASVWAFVQPVAIYYLIFGKSVIEAYEYFYLRLSEAFSFPKESLLVVFGALLAAKVVLAWIAVALALKLPESKVKKLEERFLLQAARSGKLARIGTAASGPESLGRRAREAARDLLHPLFILSLALTGLFFHFADASGSRLVWVLLRPIAFAFILFFFVRSISFERMLSWLERRGYTSFSRSFRSAIRTIREIQ